MYVNPFWHRDALMLSDLTPDECRRRLRIAPTDANDVGRLWIGRGDVNFYDHPSPRGGSLFEMHVRVKVSAGQSAGSQLRLRFSGGVGSAIVLSVVAVGCAAAFLLVLANLLSGAAWVPFDGAGLLAILVPILLVLALRAEAPDDQRDLWNFVAAAADGRRPED